MSILCGSRICKTRDRINSALVLGILLVYGFWSSSTPDSLGLPEILIGLFLLILIGLGSPVYSLGGFFGGAKVGSLDLLNIAFLYFFIVPTVVGVFGYQNKLVDVGRDFVPILYFFLPVFLLQGKSLSRSIYWAILIGLCFVGVAFSVRHFMSDEFGLEALGEKVVFGDDNYFPLDPAVLFSSTVLLTGALVQLKGNRLLLSLFISFFGLVAFSSLVGILLRAQIILVVSSVFIVLVLCLIFRGGNNNNIIIGLLVGVLLLFSVVDGPADFVSAIWSLMMQKFQSVGALNSRDLEAAAILRSNSADVARLLFGAGWGGTIFNPAAGDVVRFTHNFVMYVIFKSGLLGFVFMALGLLPVAFEFLFAFWGSVIRGRLIAIPSGFAILNVFIINLMVEGGYKMLSFGFVLTLAFMYPSVFWVEEDRGRGN